MIRTGFFNFFKIIKSNKFYFSLIISAFFLEALFLIGFISFKPPAIYIPWAGHLLFLGYAFWISLKKLFGLTSEFGKIKTIFIAAIILWLLTILLLAFPPTTARDALIYHLYVPKLWLAKGQITEMPWLDSSYFSLLTSLAYAGFISLGLERLTQYYHFLYLPISAALVADLTLRLGGNKKSQLISALILITTPICLRLSSEAMADLVVVSFFTLAFIFLLDWASSKESKNLSILSGIAVGFALSSKYTAILAAVYFPALYLCVRNLEPIAIRLRLKAIVFFALGGVISYGPWIGRNIIWTGNPVFPFLSSIFGDSTQAAYIGELSAVQYRMAAYGETWLQFFLLPFRMVAEGKDGSAATFDGQLTALYLLLPLAILPIVRSVIPKLFFWPILTFILLHLWSAPILHHALIRYQAAVAGPIIALIAISISQLYQSNRASKIGVSGLVLVHLFTSLNYLALLLNSRESLSYILSSDTSRSYLSKHLDEFGAAELAAELPPDSKIYLIHTGNKFYLYPREVFGDYFSTTPILQWLENTENNEHFLPENFKKLSITHILAHKRRISESLQGEFNKNPKLISRWTDILEKRLTVEGETEKYIVWRIVR